MKVIFYNLLFLAILGILGSIAAEVFLRFDGRYADLVNENLIHSRAIWDRPANETQHRSHPDLDYDVEINFNEFNIRNHQGVTLKDVDEFPGEVVGFFGDSFTENRRVDDKFTFTTLLNELLNPDFLVLNLGIDGYGLDQSYLKYLAFSEQSKPDHVFYLFVENDLRNIYENQLFDFGSREIGKPKVHQISLFVRVARKFHMTYLLMDSYVRLKAKVNEEPYASSELNDKLRTRFRPDVINAKPDRYHDDYADAITRDYLSDSPSESTLEWAERFRQLLDAWKSDTDSAGQNFVIFVLPNEISTNLAKKLFGQQFSDQTVYMIDHFPEGFRQFEFENDGHWNEKGNLRAGQAIADWGASTKLWSRRSERLASLTERTERAIEERYAQYQ